jgi:hypothetical protein
MTEEELEDLQWQLGDFGPAGGYGSRGTKRRKDPIEITIEEMEAELEETKEVIRKRRRGNLGLMLKPLWMLMIVACLAGEPAAAFTAKDCYSGVIFTPGARCMRQLGQGRRGRDHGVRRDRPNKTG